MRCTGANRGVYHAPRKARGRGGLGLTGRAAGVAAAPANEGNPGGRWRPPPPSHVCRSTQRTSKAEAYCRCRQAAAAERTVGAADRASHCADGGRMRAPRGAALTSPTEGDGNSPEMSTFSSGGKRGGTGAFDGRRWKHRRKERIVAAVLVEPRRKRRQADMVVLGKEGKMPVKHRTTLQ